MDMAVFQSDFPDLAHSLLIPVIDAQIIDVMKIFNDI